MTKKARNQLDWVLAGFVAFSSVFSAAPSYSQDFRTALLNQVVPASGALDSYLLAMRGRILHVVDNMTSGASPILSPVWGPRIAAFLDSGTIRPSRSNSTAVRLLRGNDSNEIQFGLPQGFASVWKCESEETQVAHEVLHVVQTENESSAPHSLESLTWIEPLENAAALAEVRYFSGCAAPATNPELNDLAILYRSGQRSKLQGLLEARVPDRKIAEKLVSLSLADGRKVLEGMKSVVSLMGQTVERAREARSRKELTQVFREIRAYQRYLPERMERVLSTGVRSRDDLEKRGRIAKGGVREIQEELKPLYNERVSEIWAARHQAWEDLAIIQ